MWKHMFIIISGALAAKETNVQYMYNKPVVSRTAHTISIVLTSFYNASTALLPSTPSLSLVVCNLHIR